MSEEQRFRLAISVQVRQLTHQPGYGGKPGDWYDSGQSGLEIRDSLDMTAGSFMAILGRFHELAEALKAERT